MRKFLLSILAVLALALPGSPASKPPQGAIVQVLSSEGRSPKWAALSKHYKLEHPRCAGCGTLQGVQVHHIIPFHTDPTMELNVSNLISLCKGRCHLKIGHGGSYQSFNPLARQDAAFALANPTSYAEAAAAAKAHRLRNEPSFEK